MEKDLGLLEFDADSLVMFFPTFQSNRQGYSYKTAGPLEAVENTSLRNVNNDSLWRHDTSNKNWIRSNTTGRTTNVAKPENSAQNIRSIYIQYKCKDCVHLHIFLRDFHLINWTEVAGRSGSTLIWKVNGRIYWVDTQFRFYSVKTLLIHVVRHYTG